MANLPAEKVSLFWGAWDMWNGAWHPNPYITMSRAEQHRQNMEAGYSCIHERMPTLCPVCKSTHSTRPAPPDELHLVMCCRAGCKNQMRLPYTDSSRTAVDLTQANGWYFSTDTGWLCPKDAPRPAQSESGNG